MSRKTKAQREQENEQLRQGADEDYADGGDGQRGAGSADQSEPEAGGGGGTESGHPVESDGAGESEVDDLGVDSDDDESTVGDSAGDADGSGAESESEDIDSVEQHTTHDVDPDNQIPVDEDGNPDPNHYSQVDTSDPGVKAKLEGFLANPVAGGEFPDRYANSTVVNGEDDPNKNRIRRF